MAEVWPDGQDVRSADTAAASDEVGHDLAVVGRMAAHGVDSADVLNSVGVVRIEGAAVSVGPPTHPSTAPELRLPAHVFEHDTASVCCRRRVADPSHTGWSICSSATKGGVDAVRGRRHRRVDVA